MDKNTNKITEEMGLQKDWYNEAKSMTLEKLPKFLDDLQQYEHDYGTICHCLTAAALATIYALDNKPDFGGITGYQSTAIMWEFIRQWTGKKEDPLRLQNIRNMLYPQYENSFTKIPVDTFNWLQEQAKTILASEKSLHPEVREHMQSIVDGAVPFGFTLEEED